MSIQALKDILENENIIKKEADKGCAVVILDQIYFRIKIQEIQLTKVFINIEILSFETQFNRTSQQSQAKSCLSYIRA